MNSESLREQAGVIGGKRFSRMMTIAKLLHMGASTHVAHLLYHRRDDV
jgi:hypothetical protein